MMLPYFYKVREDLTQRDGGIARHAGHLVTLQDVAETREGFVIAFDRRCACSYVMRRSDLMPQDAR